MKRLNGVTQGLVFGFTAAVAFALSGCSDEAVGSRSKSVPPLPKGTGGEYSLKVFVKRGDEPTQRLEVGPLNSSPAVADDGSHSAADTDGLKAPGVQELATLGRGDSTTDTNEYDAAKRMASGWTLMKWALMTCVGADESSGRVLNSPVNKPVLGITGAPWLKKQFDSSLKTDYFFFWKNDPDGDSTPLRDNCDSALYMQESLLCAADRLAQLADSPGTVTWRVPPSADVAGEEDEVETTVTIPPQDAKDMFIARDMALNVAANIAAIDSHISDARGQYGADIQCSGLYAATADDGEVRNNVFGWPSLYFDPPLDGFASSDPVPLDLEEATEAEVQEAARRRLRRKANMLAATARLTNQLLEDSIEQDMSGAQQFLSAAGKSQSGSRMAWGMEEGQSSYNTYRHALRLLFGRLERGNNRNPSVSLARLPDFKNGPQQLWTPHGAMRDEVGCRRVLDGPLLTDGPLSLDILPNLRNGMSARWNDVPPSSPDEVTALSLVDSGGIIIPHAFPNDAALVDLIARELVGQAAGTAGTSAFLQTEFGKAYDANVRRISGSAYRFATARVYDAFRIVTDSDVIPEWWDLDDIAETLYSTISAAGMTPAHLSETHLANGMAVIQGGLPRTHVSLDNLSAFDSAQYSASCGMYPIDGIGGDDCFEGGCTGWFKPLDPLETAFKPSGMDVIAFQNVFLLGQTLRRHLGSIAEYVEDQNDSSLDDIAQFASTAASEARGWAGAGWMVRYLKDDTNHVSFMDVSLEELGVESPAELGDRLILLDPLWAGVQSDCIAGVRAGCSAEEKLASADSFGAVYRPNAVPTLEEVPVGLKNERIEVAFDTTTSKNLLAVVIAANGKQGRVLGGLRGPVDDDEFFAEAISERQRELVNKIVSGRQIKSINRTCSDIAPLAISQDYCIAGMSKDEFVPLANSITSTGTGTEDSYKHYLDVAEQAAARADQLGNDLIQAGIQQDIRKESASEELSQICGVYPNDAQKNVSTPDGNPAVDPADEQLASCVNPKNYDIVFFRKDLLLDYSQEPNQAGEFPSVARADICAKLCGVNEDGTAADDVPDGFRPVAPFCQRKCVAGNTEEITHAALNFQSEQPSAVTESSDQCQPLLDTLESTTSTTRGKINLGKLQEAVKAGMADAATLQSSLSVLKLVETEDNEWVLTVGNKPIMGTEALAEQLLAAAGAAASNINDVWPVCGSSCTDRAQVLGDFFGAPDAEDPSHSDIRKRVERAVFFMGAMAGGIPDGTFNIPIPVVNRVDAQTPDFPAPAYYSPGSFAEDTTGTCATNDDDERVHYKPDMEAFRGLGAFTNDDVNAMPCVHPLEGSEANEAYLSDRFSRINWRNEVFSNAYNMVSSGNGLTEILFTDPVPNVQLSFDERPELSTDNGLRAGLPEWVTHRFSDLDQGKLTAEAVQSITYYTPGRFCKEGNLRRGRHVCTTGAAISPVFYATTPASLVDGRMDHCDGYGNQPIDNLLFSTTRVKCWDPGMAIVNPTRAAGSQVGAVACPQVGVDQIGRPILDCCAPHGSRFIWSDTIGPCSSQGQVQYSVGSGACEQVEKVDDVFPTMGGRDKVSMIAQDRLRPLQCSPSERVELFVESDVANDWDAAQALIQAMGLACASFSGSIDLTFPPPAIKSTDEMTYLSRWLGAYANAVWATADFYYLVDVPEVAVGAIASGTSNVSAVTQGDRGQALLDLEQQLRDIESMTSGLALSLAKMGSEVNNARVSIEGVNLSAEAASLEIALKRVEAERQIALAEAAQTQSLIGSIMSVVSQGAACYFSAGVSTQSCAGAFDSFGKVATAAGIKAASVLATEAATSALGANETQININSAKQTQKILDEQAQNVEQTKANGIQQVLIGMGDNLRDLYTAVDQQQSGLGNSTSGALKSIGHLNQTTSKANIALAKAQGADFVSLNGSEVPIHLNTVYRRQFDITQERYTRALGSAKRAAYLARLAIEERLGVRMDDLHEEVGPLQAPSLWVDDLCTVQGVDYDALREAVPSDATDRDDVEADLIEGFANQYVGDYVARLREFVEFYNLQFPFAEADDVALISMKDDVRSPEEACFEQSHNLLAHSDRLQSLPPAGGELGSPTSLGGWSITGCDSSYCPVATDADSLKDAQNDPLQPPAPGGATWLHTVAASAVEEPITIAPSGLVFQTVSLKAGQAYVLSWWDQARASDGARLSASAAVSDLRVAIYDSSWNLVTSAAPDLTREWSERRHLSVLPIDDGEYNVAFSPALVGGAGSVVVANVQLETVASYSSPAKEYVSNHESRMHLSGSCKPTTDTFRKRFDYECENGTCWHVLRDRFVLDTEAINQGGSALVGKIAQGNFNYRIGGVALNLVGSGLLDCGGQGTGCYQSSYLEYELVHEAFNVPMEDQRGGVTCFNFGAGAIRSGKAIAAERMLTLPLGSTDRELVSTPPFLKNELVGRPLSGVYKLRIKESPALAWSNLDDVQLLLSYRYWSRVDANASM